MDIVLIGGETGGGWQDHFGNRYWSHAGQQGENLLFVEHRA